MGKPKANLLTKLLISYFLVLLFPIAMILFYYYPYSADVVKEKELDWNAHITEQFMTSMDTFTRYVYNLPYELVQNREFRMYKAEESDYQRVLIANEMKKYNATDAFIYNTLLYVKNIGYLFSKTGSAYSVQDLAIPGVGFYYEDWPHEEMVDTLNTLNQPIVRPVENVIIPGHNRLRLLTFLQPLPVGGSNSPGAVLIMVREDTILRMMRSVSEIYTGDFFIFDNEGRPLVASNKKIYEASDDMSALVKGMGADPGATSGIERINGISYLVSTSVSDKNGWKYVSLIPVSESLQGLRTIQWNTALLVGLVLLLEVIVVYISIRKNYHPIKRLVDVAVSLFEPQQRRPMNEIDTIRYTLNELSAANSRLDERVKGTLPIMRDNILFGLVVGQYGTWEAFAQEADKVGVAFDGSQPGSETKPQGSPFHDPPSPIDPAQEAPPAAVPVDPAQEASSPAASVLETMQGGDPALPGGTILTVAVLACESEEEFNTAADFCRQAEDRWPDGVNGYFCRSVYHHEIVLICAHPPSFPLQAFLTQLQEELVGAEGTRVMIGIGRPGDYRCPRAAQTSYLQALRTVEHVRVRETAPVLTFDEIGATHSGAVSYVAEMLQSLELSILKNEPEMVAGLTERLIGYTRSDGMPPHMIRSVYLNTVTVIINGLQRFRREDQTLLRLTDAAFKPRYTMEQMIGIIRESSLKLCEFIRDTVPAARTATREEILAVIDEKGLDPSCSLQLMADHFGMSVSNFSHHFKKTMGQNFKEYIERLRIQTSIQLLRETDETLESIAQKSGYTNTSSFIRAFKKIMGTTPGQYRNTHKDA